MVQAKPGQRPSSPPSHAVTRTGRVHKLLVPMLTAIGLGQVQGKSLAGGEVEPGFLKCCLASLASPNRTQVPATEEGGVCQLVEKSAHPA